MPDQPPPAAPALPLVRDCRPGGLRPLLAPGGRDTYFSPDVQRLLFAADEPIARFLPPAKWSMPDRQERAQDGRAAQVAYTVPDEILKTATPLTTLSRAEIEAFAGAVSLFLAKARPDAKGVPPFIRQCRGDFHLPDPDIDASFYWVYGPEFDRRLLILWGLEPQAGTSLTLDKVIEKLRAREMSWRDKQDLGLKLALRPDETLARFLAPRATDGGLVIHGMNVPQKKLRRLTTLTPDEWRAFDTAARAYYAKAHEDAAGTAPFEKEIRAAFRLPGFEQVPGDFYLRGSRLLIALDAWPREKTLPMTDDSALKLPETAPATGSAAAAVATGGATVAAQLSMRQQPWWVKYAKMAALLVVVAGAGFGAWLALRPPPATQLVEAQATDDHTVELTFTTAIAELTLMAKTGAEEPLAFLEDKMKIAARNLKPGAPQKVIVQVEGRFVDGEKYGIAIRNLAPPKGRPILPSDAEFTYNDRTAPRLETCSAGGKTKKNLLLVFSKPVAESTLTPSRFAIYPFDRGERGKRLNVVDAAFDKEDKTGVTVLLEANDDFVGGKIYVIDLTGVTDRAVKPNQVEEKSAMNRQFTYKNVLPPRLGDVVANGGKFEVALTFNAPVDPALARDESNYALADPDKKPLRLLKGGINIDDAGTTVALRLEPQRLTAGQHQLTVARMADKLGNVTKAAIQRPFAFNDSSDHRPPAVASVDGPTGSLMKDDRIMRLRFDRAIDAESAAVAAHYRVFDTQHRLIEIESVAPASDDPSHVVLQLAHALGGAGEYAIETSGLINVFGVAQPAPVLTKFQISGATPRPPSFIDWAQAPVLRSGGQVLVLSITPRVTEESARVQSNYEFEPATAKVERIEKFDPGTEDSRVTVITLRLSAPAKEAFTVSAQNLIIEGRPQRGKQYLKPRPIMIEP
jgi:hypothetical protein